MCFISWGARNCAFLMLITASVLAMATTRSVCRERKAGSWMMSHTPPLARLVGLVDVGDHRHAEGGLELFEDAQAGFHARTAIAGHGGAVGLVEAGLEDVGDASFSVT